MTTAQAVDEATPVVPPFRPDPEIIGNIEGNDRIREQDQAAAREYLARNHLTAPGDDPVTHGPSSRRAS